MPDHPSGLILGIPRLSLVPCQATLGVSRRVGLDAPRGENVPRGRQGPGRGHRGRQAPQHGRHKTSFPRHLALLAKNRSLQKGRECSKRAAGTPERISWDRQRMATRWRGPAVGSRKRSRDCEKLTMVSRLATIAGRGLVGRVATRRRSDKRFHHAGSRPGLRCPLREEKP